MGNCVGKCLKPGVGPEPLQPPKLIKNQTAVPNLKESEEDHHSNKAITLTRLGDPSESPRKMRFNLK